jgi:hypothetical protein
MCGQSSNVCDTQVPRHQHNNIKVFVVIYTVHVNLLETYSLSGYWNSFEDWKRDLVAVTVQSARDPIHPGMVELWDFAEYDQYSTTDLPRATDWFWGSNHYTRQLGERVLRRLFGTGEPGFGVRLTAETLESDLHVTREHQRQYRQTHLVLLCHKSDGLHGPPTAGTDRKREYQSGSKFQAHGADGVTRVAFGTHGENRAG